MGFPPVAGLFFYYSRKGVTSVKTCKTIKKTLAAVLAASMLLSGSALAAGSDQAPAAEAAQQESETLFLSLTEESSRTVTFQLSDDAFAAVNGKEVTWTLERIATYANPQDGKFIPLHGEDEMYPNEQDTIDLAHVGEAYANYLKVSELSTAFDAQQKTVTLSFTISPMISRNNISAPHANGGAYLDVCGLFELTAAVDGQKVALGKDVTVELKPYESFHTMWEIYEELDRLAGLGDDDAATAVPYVAQKVMGQSAAGYDMPYLIIAKDSAAVTNWLELCERAETEPDKVMAEIKAGTLDYQVPIVYSNIHANEVAATDAVLEFAKMLVEQETIDYTKLTGLTEAGAAKVAEQRAALGLHTPELIQDMTTYLGSILPDSSVENGKQNSGKVENFDAYYDSEEVALSVAELLEDVFFILVPEENVEGRMYVTRTSSGGYDLNRDNSFQTQAETQNMQHLIATYNPVTLAEFHGQVVTYQVEPCSPPHEPNVEYDLLSRHLMAGGEAFGAAAVANNDDWQSYAIPMRDYLTSDENGDPFWAEPWDDMSTSYTPQFAMLQGCVAYTVELPAYSESGTDADVYGMVGLSDYVAAEKEGYFLAQLEIYDRCLNNKNSDEIVAPWFADASDVEGAEADLFRPAYDGEGENGQFFPECYIIPLDSANQTNLQAAYDLIEWLTRNDVKVGITDKEFTYEGVTYPAGTMIVSMYQAKRAVANGVLYDGTVIRNWTELYSEGITAFNYTRGFDMIVCAEPAAYETIAAAVGQTLDYDSASAFLQANAKSQFSGAAGGDVIISNASEDSTAAVNALLKAGKKVAMITEGQYEGDFLCSYADWQTVAGDYVLTGTGVVDADVTAYVIEKAPAVYISGTAKALTQTASGYTYTTLVASSYAYNYDRMALDMMNFNVTEDASQADAVIGASALDSAALAAVQSGVPYIGYTSAAVNAVNENVLALSTARTEGMDCLGYVTYPEKTLTNASYISDGDNVLYGYGTLYFTAVPEGAKVLVQRDGSEPMEGFLNGDEDSYQAFLNGIQGFSYEGADKDGNQINLTLFANTLTNKAHQRDEYAFISNTIFANLLSDETYYAGAAETVNRAQAVTALWAAAGSPAPTSAANPFTDVVSGAEYLNAVLWAVEQGITEGTSATTFNPDQTVDRAQAVTFLWRMAGAPVSSAANPFTDVAAGAYYADAAVWAVTAGVTAGNGADTFGPAQNCTGAQIETMLARYLGD